MFMFYSIILASALGSLLGRAVAEKDIFAAVVVLFGCVGLFGMGFSHYVQ